MSVMDSGQGLGELLQQGQSVGFRAGVRAALRIFAVQRWRTIFAMMGVFLGALLLTGISHVLGSISLRIEDQARNLGSHVITITAEQPHFSRGPDVQVFDDGKLEKEAGGSSDHDERYSTLESAATLTLDDMKAAVEEIPHIIAGVPYVLSDAMVIKGNRTSGCSVMGVSPSYPDMHNVSPAGGRFFTELENKQAALVCLLGDGLARRLFGDPDSALGDYVRIDRNTVLVVGVMAARGASSSGTNMDEVAFVPIRTGMQRFSTRDHISGFYLTMKDRETIPVLRQSLESLLRKRHHLASAEDSDFSISFAGQVEDMVAQAMELMTTLGFIGAGISFFVGSLGIFSIMILMVHARKNEIGIRRAVGAPRRLILQQFLFEAGLMAGVGGVAGVTAALVIMQLVAFFDFLPGYLNLSLSFGICLLSVGCGIMAGGYPAWKAAKLEVLAALRQ